MAVAYLSSYLVLDWISFIHPMRGLNITPWNPQSAVAVALLMWRPAAWWLVWIGLVAGDVVVRGMPAWWPPSLLAAVMLTCGHLALAFALAGWLGHRLEVATRRDFVAFLIIVALGAILNAVLYAMAFAVFGMSGVDRAMAAVLRGSIGDAVGYLVTLPLIFIVAIQGRRARTAAMMRSPEWWLVVVLAVLSAYAVFGRATEEQFKYFYLLFVPVVWAAARFGVTGAVWASAVVQLLLVAAFQSNPYLPLTVFELQVLMAALAATGLLLGTTVEEREAADEKLRASLHRAAAGDMAAALAHELNQPLTALTTYARASQLLADRLGTQDPSVARPLVDTAAKLVNEANRASDVVKRLRDFFRNRSTELKLTPIAPLIAAVMRTQEARAQSMGLRLDWRCDDTLPDVWMDPVQIEVVLRNLVSNALDACVQAPIGDGEVSVHAQRDGDHLTVTVCDGGRGVAMEELAGVFERHASSKPGGMGIGLAISRSIVQAHGGRMWAEPGPGGKFSFSLPLSSQSHE